MRINALQACFLAVGLGLVSACGATIVDTDETEQGLGSDTNGSQQGSREQADLKGGVQCGKTVCEAGMVCCNASCGICTPPGGVCIQLACEEEPPAQGASCAATLCPVNTKCVEGERGATCVALGADPCDTFACPPDRVCRSVDGKATCEPVQQDPATCAVALCPPGTYCDDSTGNVECLEKPSCDGVKCEGGTHCEVREVQCIRAPCPPQPTCVPDAEGQPCGDNVCGAGTFCCNPSCGICAPKGGACTQQFCAPKR
jgi:hypothetical protein